jgi:hypothetical protein
LRLQPRSNDVLTSSERRAVRMLNVGASTIEQNVGASTIERKVGVPTIE